MKKKIKKLAKQILKLFISILLIFMSIICTFYSVVKFILSDFEQWYYILLIPISITLIIVLVEIIDWGKLGNFDYWNEIDIDI